MLDDPAGEKKTHQADEFLPFSPCVDVCKLAAFVGIF
jgi:hypothetical protein